MSHLALISIIEAKKVRVPTVPHFGCHAPLINRFQRINNYAYGVTAK